MIRRPVFGQDDGLASVAAMQASTSGKTTRFCCSSSLAAAVDTTLLCRSPRPATQADHHFLEACFLCRKPLGSDTIFMYRGDTPFCSEECRREQMKMDGVAEEEEDDWILIDKVNSASRKEAPQKSADKAPNYHVRAGTVSAAG